MHLNFLLPFRIMASSASGIVRNYSYVQAVEQGQIEPLSENTMTLHSQQKCTFRNFVHQRALVGMFASSAIAMAGMTSAATKSALSFEAQPNAVDAAIGLLGAFGFGLSAIAWSMTKPKIEETRQETLI